MKILHSYCLNYNVGDYALGFGVKNVLRRYLNVECIGNTNIQGREFTPYYIDEVVNKRYDLLVLGGGGIIHGAHWPQGWFWLIERELISRIKIPFMVYGAGYNYFPGEDKIPKRGVKHLQETKKNALYFSVRNDGSRQRLMDATGIQSDVIPDPGFHVPMGRKWGEPIEREFVVVQLADDKSEFRYSGSGRRKTFVAEMRKVIAHLVEKYEVILIPHVYDDIAISNEVTDSIPGATVLNFGSYAFDQCEKVIPYYRDARFVLAMRGHGQIVPLGFKTPVITFSAHHKIKGMMDYLGLQEWHVDLHAESFAVRLLEKVAALESGWPETIEQLSQLVAGLEAETDGQFRRVLKEFDN